MIRKVGHNDIIAVVLALLLAACGGADEAGDTTAPQAPAGDSTTTSEAGEPASGEPIRIGLLSAFTGPFAIWGIQLRDGMQLAVDEINAEGGVNGRPVELVERDTQGEPDVGALGLERLVEDDVVAAGGVISSGVGVSAGVVAEELQVPLLLGKAGAAEVLTADSRYTFRTCLPAAPMIGQAFAQYVEENDLSRIGAIIADYAYGQSVGQALEQSVGALDEVELQIEVAPVTEAEFTPYLRNLDDIDPELITASGHPPGAGTILQQSAALGLDVPITGAYGGLSAELQAVGELAYDRYSDFGCIDFGSDDYQDLAARYGQSAERSFMDEHAVTGYGIVQVIAEAVGAVGDDPTAVAEYLHANEFEVPGYSFTVSWTEWGELAQATPAFSIVRGQAPPEDVSVGLEWYPEVLFLTEPLDPHMPG